MTSSTRSMIVAYLVIVVSSLCSVVISFHLRDDMKEWNKKKEHPITYGTSRESFSTMGGSLDAMLNMLSNKGSVFRCKES